MHLRGFTLLHQQADLATPLGKFLQLHGPWREEVHGLGDLECQGTGQLERAGGEAFRLGVALLSKIMVNHDMTQTGMLAATQLSSLRRAETTVPMTAHT